MGMPPEPPSFLGLRLELRPRCGAFGLISGFAGFFNVGSGFKQKSGGTHGLDIMEVFFVKSKIYKSLFQRGESYNEGSQSEKKTATQTKRKNENVSELIHRRVGVSQCVVM